MKSKRTIRTMKRCGINPASVGFAGYTPTGKAVRRLAREKTAEKLLLASLPRPMINVFWRSDITARASIKACTSYLRWPPVVQQACITLATS